MSYVLATSLGLAVAGPIGGMLAMGIPWAWKQFHARKRPDPSIRLVLLLLLVELRSGLSVLASLIAVSDSIPGYRNLRTVARIAQVAGLTDALPYAEGRLRPVVAQLSRAQKTGASLTGAVRRMLDEDLAADRARRIARARTLPVRLMIPVTLLMLPGLVLFIYAPSLLGMFEDLTGVLS